jgi:uncharacterized protein
VKIVFDTNVLIAAFIAQGVCHKLFEHCIVHHAVLVSEFILDELKEKFTNKFKFNDETINEVEILLRSRLEIVKPEKLEPPVCRDLDDDNILAAALSGNCDCIVTGDKDLLVLENFKGIKILSPSDFAEYESNFV